MRKNLHPRLSIRFLLSPVLAALTTLGALSACLAADDSDLAEGMRLFMQKGNCQACHGWAGDGKKVDNQMPDGANLRAMDLDRSTLIMFVKCGVPGTGMPAFDKFAYSDGRCYGKRLAELRAEGVHLADPPATLQPREVELLADFVMEKILNKGPITKAQCTAFWGAAERCTDLQ